MQASEVRPSLVKLVFRKEVLKPDGRLRGAKTAILNLSAGKGIQLPGRNVLIHVSWDNKLWMRYKHLIGSEAEKDGLSYWGHPVARPVPMRVAQTLALINETYCNVFGKALLSPALARVTLSFTQRTYVFSNKSPGA